MRRDHQGMSTGGIVSLSSACVVLLLLVIGGGMYGCPKYNVWQQGLRGKAALARAEQDRQIAIEEAKALQESAGFQAEAEITRARGVAKANAIIGDSLKDNEAYLRYLFIQGLHDGSSEIIYVPTEAQLPVLEATRLNGAHAPPE